MRNKVWFLLLPLVFVMMISCDWSRDYLSFYPMANFPEGDVVYLDMDLQGVVNQGIVLPSDNQSTDGGFIFTFEGKEGQYYKIYYQNESYKFDENSEFGTENFYGSWEDTDIGFKKVPADGVVTDTFRIVGNPRNERKYYGTDVSEKLYSKEILSNYIESIKNDPYCYKYMIEKAEKNGCAIDRQLALDAVWLINANKNKGDFNHRWKRNPRVGVYSFMLVVCDDEETLKTLDKRVVDISKTDENGSFVNPYAYFKTKKDNVSVVVSPRVLKTRAVITPKSGVFIDELKVKTDYYSIVESDMIGTSEKLYEEALFEQFICQVSKQYTLRNIPVIKDVVSDDDPYTMAEYEANKTRFDSSELKNDHPVGSRMLGATLRIDDDKNGLVLINPGNNDIENLKKESTGVRTRVGFTYGKFRGKIKFPVMLNDENIWNGLTNAFWLLNQENHAWNNRRPSKSGYINRTDNSDNPQRLTDYFYSEIDIEIAKASRYWPKWYYLLNGKDIIIEDGTKNNEVMYTCTNWDLASTDPKKFKPRIDTISYKGHDYEAMRWTELSKALSIKTPISNEVFKNDYYYYEIDWYPTEIIWRIGPSPDNMRVVGYMSDENTSIPNNQMTCVMTQEYHYSEWWKPVVFWQGLIPYNKSDIEGEIFEIVVE